MERRSHRDPEFGAALERAHHRYATERDAHVPIGAEHQPSGGVGGARVGVKCLHGHYADHAAGNQNPVGVLTAPWVGPLDCEIACVVSNGDEAVANPDWREPS